MVKDYVSKPLSWLWGGSTNEPALPVLLPPPVQERVAWTFPTDQVIDHPATPAHCITAPGLQIDARPAECFEQQSQFVQPPSGSQQQPFDTFKPSLVEQDAHQNHSGVFGGAPSPNASRIQFPSVVMPVMRDKENENGPVQSGAIADWQVMVTSSAGVSTAAGRFACWVCVGGVVV